MIKEKKGSSNLYLLCTRHASNKISYLLLFETQINSNPGQPAFYLSSLGSFCLQKQSSSPPDSLLLADTLHKWEKDYVLVCAVCVWAIIHPYLNLTFVTVPGRWAASLSLPKAIWSTREIPNPQIPGPKPCVFHPTRVTHSVPQPLGSVLYTKLLFLHFLCHVSYPSGHFLSEAIYSLFLVPG